MSERGGRPTTGNPRWPSRVSNEGSAKWWTGFPLRHSKREWEGGREVVEKQENPPSRFE